MNNREKELLNKYLEGKTTLREEQELRKLQNSMESGTASWFSFLEQQSVAIPENLSKQLWEESQVKQARKSIGIKALVLGLICLVVFSIVLFSHLTQEEPPRNTIYQEAMALIGDNTIESDKEVFYKNDLITIYLSYEQ